ncbi:MAG: bifunctional 3-(3-hydroxy-phenyl)propionate/3-hydroxycinnamic acid hydroxylase [Streptosporangiaceae bacterium]|nr:bifunctional 3-(3-hydroxy-phenyl)propionate/3-hydroxycinnamic acid hydroxylase [Streptosporangiaceae bacterium]MBV9855146.1 bifunctional 3-(3-hydroxy-phenyl)propionate/3-hydroxycinnamic acid hydroxylase [Streptosporangiaceae bacterium]
MNDQHYATGEPVIVVGAGPVGCTAALLLAGFGIPVTLLERHAEPHPLPRAVHLDDEVARTLHRIGVSEEFLARSRPCSGLRLLDARHRVMAEFRRDQQAGVHGFPQANMFHQPDLEELMLARIARHPLIDLRRGAEVLRVDGALGPLTTSPVRVHARLAAGQAVAFTGPVVLGCDGAGSTVRKLAGITMDDLGFTERWLVIDIRTATALDTWDGAEQVCDPARAATFMQVTGDRYRWEFQLRDGEDEATLTTPDALGRLLRPWTGRGDLAGLEIIRTASYTFRARLASRFQAGRIFLLGDAAHLTPPFIGQGLAAGLRDAGNLAWKIAQVLTGQAGEDLLASYDTERRPHARAMVRKAVRVGWAMTGGQDRAAAVRRIALAAVVRSDRVRQAMVSTATPRLKAGALQNAPRRLLPSRAPAALRTGGLIPNPLVSTGDGPPVRLDTILAGRTAVLTARQPEAVLADFCGRHHLLLVRVSGPSEAGDQAQSGAGTRTGWAGIRLARHERSAAMQALTGNPALSIIVRPDRVVAAVESGSRVPRLPWHVPPPQPRPRPAGAAPAARPVRSLEPHPSGGLHVRCSVTAAGRGLSPAGRGQADRPPEDARIGRPLRHPLAALPAHRRGRAGRRRRRPGRPVVAPPRPGRGGRDGRPPHRRHDHPPAGGRQRERDGWRPARADPHRRLPGRRPHRLSPARWSGKCEARRW